ncbi:MAG: SdrD B-like domain-containing protein, partial [Acidimicrobiia bacterium]
TIGEEITYTATVVIPQGTTVHGPAVFTDSLAPELELLSASHTFDGVPSTDASYPTINVNTSTDVVTVTFADPYTNPIGTDDTLTVTIVARVANTGTNLIGTDVRNDAEFRWEDAAGTSLGPIGASVATDIVEPDISLAKTNNDSDGVVVGGDMVTYTLGITNGSGADVSTAHDIVVLDILPEGITPPTGISDGGIFTPDGIPDNGVLGTILWTISSVDPATTVNRTYDVTIDNPVIVNTSFTNNAAVSVTSMAGTPPGERTSGTGYADTATDTLNTPLMSIAKSVDPATATIGDTLSYELEVTIPAATIVFDTTVLDTLPAGVSFDGITGSSCESAGGSACDAVITVNQIGTVGTQTAAFFLGDIAVPAVNGLDRIVTITYDAHLLDSGSSGDTRINSANVYGNQSDLVTGTPTLPLVPGDFDVAADPATATATIVEPRLTLDKDVSDQIGDSDARRAVPGELLTYTIVVENTGTSDANDITVTDAPDSRLQPISIINGPGYVVDDADPSDGTLQWTIAGPMAPVDIVAISYDGRIPATLGSADEIVAGPEVTNIADIPSYFGVPQVERDANPTHTYRNYNNVTSDRVDIELDLASIGDRVWFDVDADGVQDAGEPGLVGVDVTVTYLGLDGVVGGGDDEVFPATTGTNGIWLVTDIPGGEYLVEVDTSDVPAGMAASYDLDDGTTAPDDAWQGTLGEDEDKRDVDFGYTGTGSIGDTVWFDRDADGVLDGDEYGLEGVDVTVTWFGLNGVSGGGDDIAYPTTTDANGVYLVEDLPAGNYSVDVDSLTLPADMVPTFDADDISTPDSSLLSLTAGENDLDQDFGYNGTGSIGDFVWLDTNGDGAQDAGELGIPDVPVQLTWPGEDGVLGGGDDETFLTTTDSSGMYLFEGLPPGEYQVDVIGGLPSAADNTFDEQGPLDSSAVVNLSNGESHLTTDFGYQGTATIGDTVWWDLNGDDVIDSGEPGIPGVEVTLTYGGVDGVVGTADDLMFTTTTDDTGAYAFTNLPAGNFEVTITDGVPSGMDPTYDEDGSDDETSVVTGLAVGDIHLTADFGYMGTGSIGDFVWIDLDADGVQDAGEPGIPDVDVTLTWYGVDNTLGGGDDVVLTTTTDIDGNYLFPNLPAGGYDVVIDTATLPAGVTQTFDADGLVSPDASSLVLGAGENNLDQDFGYNGAASIGDTVWFDRDGDGVIGADEYGIDGVDVDITWAGPDGLFSTADDEVFTTTTDIDGVYLQTDLPPGDYTVAVDTATLPSGMVPVFVEDGTLDNETSFPLGDGEAHLTADFGYRGTGSIGDFVWLDIDGDGVQDTDE